MEITLIIVLCLMIAGAIYAIEAADLLSAIVSYGIVGFGLVICFLLLKAPDLAIVQIVIETITLVIMISVILNTTKEELKEKLEKNSIWYYVIGAIFVLGFIYFFSLILDELPKFGEHLTRMATEYIEKGKESTGSVNLVTGIVLDFRGYDTLGEVTVLLTAVVGVLAVLRAKGRKKEEDTK
jgi:multisubunit Na+/H+ antiporter MnhB subunit